MRSVRFLKRVGLVVGQFEVESGYCIGQVLWLGRSDDGALTTEFLGTQARATWPIGTLREEEREMFGLLAHIVAHSQAHIDDAPT